MSWPGLTGPVSVTACLVFCFLLSVSTARASRNGTQVCPDFTKGKGSLVMAPCLCSGGTLTKGRFQALSHLSPPQLPSAGMGVTVPTLQIHGLRLREAHEATKITSLACNPAFLSSHSLSHHERLHSASPGASLSSRSCLLAAPEEGCRRLEAVGKQH